MIYSDKGHYNDEIPLHYPNSTWPSRRVSNDMNSIICECYFYVYTDISVCCRMKRTARGDEKA